MEDKSQWDENQISTRRSTENITLGSSMHVITELRLCVNKNFGRLDTRYSQMAIPLRFNSLYHCNSTTFIMVIVHQIREVTDHVLRIPKIRQRKRITKRKASHIIIQRNPYHYFNNDVERVCTNVRKIGTWYVQCTFEDNMIYLQYHPRNIKV